MAYLVCSAYDILMGKLRRHRSKSRIGKVRAERPLNLTAFAPDCTDQIYLIACAGYSDSDISRVCGVSAGKLKRWRILYPDLDKAILTGRLAPDIRVMQAAYQRAVGYDIPHTVVTDGPEGRTVRSEMTHIPPDVSAFKFWLSNRMKDEWKERKVEDRVVTYELGTRLAAAIERAGGRTGLPPIDSSSSEVTEVQT